MSSHDKGRIGVFQAEWPLQSHTVNFAIGLADAGFTVDVFLYKTPEIFDLSYLYKTPNVRVYVLPQNDEEHFRRKVSKVLEKAQWLKKILTNLRLVVLKPLRYVSEQYLLINEREDGILPCSLINETYTLIENKQYKCFIGIEKKGLIWAGKMANWLGVPYIYYSLELYTWDHPEPNKSPRAKRIKLIEEKYHKESYATIIQDKRRAEILFKDNKVELRNVIYLPVSLLGKPYKLRSIFIRDRFKLDKRQIIILYFGLICEGRFSFELAQLAQDFPKEWVLILHGLSSSSDLKKIQKIDANQRVILSLEKVPASQLQEFVASAHIGVVLYRSFPKNDYLTAFSSEKLALYLQCGLPVIAFRYPGYDILERYKCGILIDTLEELPYAVRDILSSYEAFRSNAYRCFEDYYEFSKNFSRVVDFIGNMP